ncbi:hypothetical protein ACG0Z4_14740 [Enterocloster aldenensis]|uniref:hypothetical protein n=1 Tax=Enterocloster aldenensis TaxID=358742 RepID=UPI000E4E9D5D|nr:hypothetical protein DW886_24630 [Enterocloster aldenensis]
MMEQLIKVSSVPFQAIRFTQNARLVPADNMALERHKALVRHHAFLSRFRAVSGSVDYDFLNQVNAAFSKETKASQPQVSFTGMPRAGVPAADRDASGAVSRPVPGNQSFPLRPQPVPRGDTASPVSFKAAPSGHTGQPVHAPSVQVPSEAAAAYTIQRGSFELRVAKGELSYVPPLVMTIVTQYPDIQFEYTGGFNYIPPREDSSGTNMNVSI